VHRLDDVVVSRVNFCLAADTLLPMSEACAVAFGAVTTHFTGVCIPVTLKVDWKLSGSVDDLPTIVTGNRLAELTVTR
jgi:hypothetical protein